MNAQEIVRILREIDGSARGTAADDVLYSHLSKLPIEQRDEFWAAFGQALSMLWQAPANELDNQAMDGAASLIAKLDDELKPQESMQRELLSNIPEDALSPNGNNAASWPRIAAALRILTHLNPEQKDVEFWEGQLEFWRDKGILNSSEPAHTAALDALVQANRGMIFTHGFGQQDFAMLFNVALEAIGFPAIETYSALAEETRRRTQTKEKPDTAQADIISAYHTMLAGLKSEYFSENHVDELKEVIAAWLKDEFNRDWEQINTEPDWKTPPWVDPTKPDSSPLSDTVAV